MVLLSSLYCSTYPLVLTLETGLDDVQGVAVGGVGLSGDDGSAGEDSEGVEELHFDRVIRVLKLIDI